MCHAFRYSAQIVLSEFQHGYNLYSVQQTSVLPQLQFTYLDFCVWQQKHLELHLEKSLQAWNLHLKNLDQQPINLPIDRKRPATRDGKGDSVKVSCSSVFEKCQQFCKRKRATLHSLFMSVVHLWLHKSSSQSGTPSFLSS